MKRTNIKDLKENIGEEVSISSWVDSIRSHGKLIFLDFRDGTGKVQAVVLPNANEEARGVAASLRDEWVVEVVGKVNSRPEKMVNEKE